MARWWSSPWRRPAQITPRRLREEDVIAFYEASDKRRPALGRDEIITIIRGKNSYRWWRIQHDYKWLRKQMRKLGQNPDDARELL